MNSHASRAAARPTNCGTGSCPPCGTDGSAAAGAAASQLAPAQSVALDRLDGIGAAGRGVAARRRAQRADRRPVEPDRPEHERLGRGSRPAPAQPDRRAAAKSAASTSESAPALSGRARTTVVLPIGNSASCARTTWRSRRVTRCRTTLLPTARETTNPTRGRARRPPSVRPARWCTTSVPRRARDPRRTVTAKSDERRSRWDEGSTGRRVSSAGANRARPSGRQLATALAPARSDDGAPGTRTHAQPEAVRLRAATVVRLEGALAHGQAPRSDEPARRLVQAYRRFSLRRTTQRTATQPSTVRIEAVAGQTAPGRSPVARSPGRRPTTPPTYRVDEARLPGETRTIAGEPRKLARFLRVPAKTRPCLLSSVIRRC